VDKLGKAPGSTARRLPRLLPEIAAPCQERTQGKMKRERRTKFRISFNNMANEGRPDLGYRGEVKERGGQDPQNIRL